MQKECEANANHREENRSAGLLSTWLRQCNAVVSAAGCLVFIFVLAKLLGRNDFGIYTLCTCPWVAPPPA